MSLRVSILMPEFPPDRLGGIASSHYNIYTSLKASGINVQPVVYDSPTQRTKWGKVITFVVKASCKAIFWCLAPSQKSYQFANTILGILGGLNIRKQIQSFGPNLIITPDKGCPTLLLRKDKNCQIVWISHHNPMRFVTTDDYAGSSYLDARLSVLLENQALKKAALVLCPSRYMKKEFRNTYRFEGPIHIVPNLIGPEIDKLTDKTSPVLRPQMGLPEDAPLFYIPSGGTPVKGSRFVPQILKKLSEKHSISGVYISGEIEPCLRKEIAEANKNVIVFAPGPSPYSENLKRIQDCDVCIAPILRESFGMAILEAAWFGLPVVAFAKEGVLDIIEPGMNGYLVQSENVQELVQSALRALQDLRSGSLHPESVSAFTRDKFSRASITQKLISILDTVTSQGSGERDDRLHEE